MASLGPGKDSRGKGGQRGQGCGSCDDDLSHPWLYSVRSAVGGSQVPEQ